MPDRTCSVPDCGRAYRCKGYCNTHYRRRLRHGDPSIVLPSGTVRGGCDADGCPNPHHAKGLCKGHHGLWYRRATLAARHAYEARYRASHREKAIRQAREWRINNPDRARESTRAYAQRNKERIRDQKRRYRARNRDRIRVSNQRHRALRKNALINDLTAKQWHAIKVAYRHRCAYCHKRKPLTMDHVIPLSKDGPNTASNVVPACGSCNSRKGDRAAPEYQPLLF